MRTSALYSGGMEYALLEIALEVDDGGLLTAVFNWVEVRFDAHTTTIRIDAQPWVRYDRLSVN